MTRLERSLELLRAVTAARLRFSGWAGGERVERAACELALHDEECRAFGQLNLLAFVPAAVPPRPRACEECEARAPADFATTRNGAHVWLCKRCRDGRLSDDDRRQLNVYDFVTRKRQVG